MGDEQRGWEEGKVLVFDDSFEHEVRNHGDRVRIVLFMNFWHPCFSPAEIEVSSGSAGYRPEASRSSARAMRS